MPLSSTHPVNSTKTTYVRNETTNSTNDSKQPSKAQLLALRSRP